MLLRRARPSVSLILSPLSSTRYFEFPFALSVLPKTPKMCLDVSSPNLFSFYVARRFPTASVQMINPDSADLSDSRAMVSILKFGNICLEQNDLAAALNRGHSFDCIWSISVLEHIAGAYNDEYAVKAMYDALNSGGRLILTVPVDREFWSEYRENDGYSLQRDQVDGKFFFQRYYDRSAVWERLVKAVGQEPTVVRWFGETTAGRFVEYEKRWNLQGYSCTVDDPREFTDNYREFVAWEDMPGKGVCGLMFEKT